MNRNTKMVSFTEIVNIAIIANKIVNGSFTINSKMAKREFFTSLTSPEILAIISPFFFSE